MLRLKILDDYDSLCNTINSPITTITTITNNNNKNKNNKKSTDMKCVHFENTVTVHEIPIVRNSNSIDTYCSLRQFPKRNRNFPKRNRNSRATTVRSSSSSSSSSNKANTNNNAHNARSFNLGGFLQGNETETTAPVVNDNICTSSERGRSSRSRSRSPPTGSASARSPARISPQYSYNFNSMIIKNNNDSRCRWSVNDVCSEASLNTSSLLPPLLPKRNKDKDYCGERYV